MPFVDNLTQYSEKPESVESSDTTKTRRELQEKEKEEATAKNKPWVAILDTRINEDDIKNGFFELDWNEPFIEVLLDDGYTGETQEEIVEKWFNVIIRNLLEEEGMDTDSVNSGNVVTFLKNE